MIKLGHKRGFSIIEICIYAVIFAMFMGTASAVFFWAQKSIGATQKMDDLQDLRMAALQINEELSYGNRFLFPPVSNKTYHQIVFKNERNELMCFFLDKDSRLCLLNYEKNKMGNQGGFRVIARNALEFKVERPDSHLLKYSVKIFDEKSDGHLIANAVKIRNTETNEPW
ncbi:MAG: hypothetical protein ACQES9_10645 [Myxococcota bacterium]